VDLVGLNEADFGSRRSGWVDQPAFLAAELTSLTGTTYKVVRGTTWTRDLPGLEVHFGNAVLIRHPVLAAESCVFGGGCLDISAGRPERPLGKGRWFGPEPRSVLRVRVRVGERPVQLLVTHLEAFFPARRAAQAEELTRRFRASGDPTVLAGDINATDGVMNLRRGYGGYDPTLDRLAAAGLVDARVHAAARVGAGDLAPWATYPAERPDWPLDAVLASAQLMPVAVHVIGDGEVSDHRGLYVRYAWSGEEVEQQLEAWQQALAARRQAGALACAPRHP
jgi:endonuclease/exonuclease/phosphatase family metal-dependent hydrolase